jgi:hypothetical protein
MGWNLLILKSGSDTINRLEPMGQRCSGSTNSQVQIEVPLGEIAMIILLLEAVDMEVVATVLISMIYGNGMEQTDLGFRSPLHLPGLWNKRCSHSSVIQALGLTV